jgi:hypothetical protein
LESITGILKRLQIQALKHVSAPLPLTMGVIYDKVQCGSIASHCLQFQPKTEVFMTKYVWGWSLDFALHIFFLCPRICVGLIPGCYSTYILSLSQNLCGTDPWMLLYIILSLSQNLCGIDPWMLLYIYSFSVPDYVWD